MANREQRKTYLVDREVQGYLLIRGGCYWLLSIAVVGALNVVGWVYLAPGVDALVKIRGTLPSFLGVFAIVVASSLIVLPVLLYDLVKYTNRFAGPVHRLQRALQDVAAGRVVSPLTFREGDYWHELATSFNGIVARLEVAERGAHGNERPEFDTLVSEDCPEVSSV
jgi:hypothetical protein